ncbi:PE-PPE domain-containing protein [[Mycobacterium] nativiensis]|uniref:PE-PPE domain-containing protein n=1 Tax=[Mycobacterium] nativiensis TaxID=2855503 RepID=A0ABU5XZ56_9MYCO|nr:PE-PPE domain-containing protein [Mycolicibacter sp. MYC340]MEB3033042.1 PE-PPE domain-containing protein [Mycolicibacter sp. MYC340]
MGIALRPYTTATIALVGAGMIVVGPGAPPPPNIPVRLLAGDTVGLVIGGSGVPIPGTGYVSAADALYIHPNVPGTTYPGVLANGLFTPEGLYPLDGINVLRLNYPAGSNGFPSQTTSVGQGMTILDNNIQAQLAAGNAVTVFGYSQSSTIASLEMQQLDPSGTPSDLPVQFVLIADPSNPNGGLLERFNGFETTSGVSHPLELNIPSMGISFDGATPADDFHTSIYTLEYDGFADFPRYPLNFLADLNAFLGIRELHGIYLNGGVNGSGPTPEQIANATLLPGSENSTTDPCASCLTNYYMINETAPLVAMLPKPLQDLLGPDLTYLINLGYGADNLGYSDAPANIATPFGLFPDVDPTTVINQLVAGAQQGWTAFMADLSDPSAWSSAFSSALSSAVSDAPTTALDPPTLSDIVNAFSSALSAANGGLSGLSDVANALFTALPTYEAELFITNLQNGDLLDAFGLPLAASTALDTLAAGFGLQIITNTMSDIQAAFAGL